MVALARLASTNPSPNTAEKLAETFCALATDESLRGTLVQQGGFKACVALADANSGASDKARVFAAHASGKILVTTDPNRLTDAQRLVGIRPLLWACRQLKASDLCHFECLLGLTNLLSLGRTARRRVATEKGVGALEYLQFSEHEEVQRAATEALCNMVPDRAMLDHLLKRGAPRRLFFSPRRRRGPFSSAGRRRGPFSFRGSPRRRQTPRPFSSAGRRRGRAAASRPLTRRFSAAAGSLEETRRRFRSSLQRRTARVGLPATASFSRVGRTR